MPDSSQNLSNYPSEGEKLFERVVELTGLPSDVARDELEKILAQQGHDKESVTIDELRQAMLTYLEAISDNMRANE